MPFQSSRIETGVGKVIENNVGRISLLLESHCEGAEQRGFSGAEEPRDEEKGLGHGSGVRSGRD
jgi:hypothetical protein